MPINEWSENYNNTFTNREMDLFYGNRSGGGGSYATIYRDRMDTLGDSYSQVIQANFVDSNNMSEEEKNAIGVKVLEKIKTIAKPFSVTEQDGELIISKADEYRSLGLESLARIVELRTKKILKEIGISAGDYKRINRSELEKFQQELVKISDSNSKRQLLETPLANYVGQNHSEGAIDVLAVGIPPADVLEKLKVARDSKLFDDYAVLHIQYVPDPILCGFIKESKDLYFIAEWGDDIKLTDIIK